MGMSGGSSDELNAEINVTPLVDVMLVLLIIFMITAPMMNTGVDLDLPDVQAQKVEDEQGKLVLSITKDRKLLLGASPVAWQDLKAKLELNNRLVQEKQATGAKVLWVEGDQNLPYAVVLTAMSVAREAGIDKVQLLTDPAAEIDLTELDGAATPTVPSPP